MSEPTQANGHAQRLELALRAARDSAGSARDVERLREQLQLKLKLLHEAGAATPADAARRVTSLSLGKLALVGAGLLALGALYVGLNRSPAQTPMPAAPFAASAAVRSLPEHTTAERAPANSAAHDSTQARELPAGATAPKQSAPPPKQSAGARDKAEQLSRSRAPAAPAMRSGDPRPTAARGDSATEIALITRAQSLLDLQPSAALTVLLEHEREFPRGILAEERDVLRVEAERALGRTPQAIAHAKAFCAQYPNSPQTRTLEHWLAAQISAATDHK
jgi:hypothetical protein